MSDIRAEEYENLRDLQSQEHPTLSDSKWKETLKYECAFCFPLIYHSAFRQDNTRRDGGVDNNDSQYHSIHHRESGLEHDETKGRLAQGVREREAQGRFILSSTVPKKKTTPRENIYNIANLLTFSRLIAAPVVGYMILHDMHSWAAGLFAYAAVTDLIDGWVARRFKMQTVVGSVIDPLADKSLMTITTLCLVAHGSLPSKIVVTMLHCTGLAYLTCTQSGLLASSLDVTCHSRCLPFTTDSRPCQLRRPSLDTGTSHCLLRKCTPLTCLNSTLCCNSYSSLLL